MNNIVLLKRVAVLALMSLALSLHSFAADIGKGAALLKAIDAQKLDETVSTLNQVKQAQYRGDVLPLLLDLWNNDKQKYPNLPWSFVNLDVVRINIADVLVQAHRNGQVSVDSAAIHEFAKKVATSSGDAQARSAAMLVLGIIDDPRDVSVLRSAALEERDLISTYALVSLGTMCNGDAAKALDALAGVLKDKQFVERAKDAQLRRLDTLKAKSGWCTQRPFA
jgi:hypothetical protein